MKTQLLFVTLAVAAFFSCKKEPTPNEQNPLVGFWQADSLIAFEGEIKDTITYEDGLNHIIEFKSNNTYTTDGNNFKTYTFMDDNVVIDGMSAKYEVKNDKLYLEYFDGNTGVQLNIRMWLTKNNSLNWDE